MTKNSWKKRDNSNVNSNHSHWEEKCILKPTENEQKETIQELLGISDPVSRGIWNDLNPVGNS